MKIFQGAQGAYTIAAMTGGKSAEHYFAKKKIADRVEEIFWDISKNGDEKLFYYTKTFDNNPIDSRTIRVSSKELNRAWKLVPSSDKKEINLAAKRITKFHEQQRPKGFAIREKSGAIVEQRVLPIEKIGICIPGGRAPLFSTVLMTAIPAKLAGSEDIVMISPWINGQMNAYIMVAAQIVGVKVIYKIGGAQGVAALACGTKLIKNVNKIVGPGNVWVSQAKVFAASLGFTDIDTLAGPSEILVLSDGHYSPKVIAADLISQLEHGEDSIATLITPNLKHAQNVAEEIKTLLANSARKEYLDRALKTGATALVTKNLREAIKVTNMVAPEHLEILVRNPRKVLPLIKNAASVFLGPFSPVPIGDYLAGPNHVLPTELRARFASPLGVEDFVKRQSVVEFSKEALLKLGPVAERMAELEGLDGHARAIRIRRESLSKKKKK